MTSDEIFLGIQDRGEEADCWSDHPVSTRWKHARLPHKELRRKRADGSGNVRERGFKIVWRRGGGGIDYRDSSG